jgi:hypothetical protein
MMMIFVSRKDKGFGSKKQSVLNHPSIWPDAWMHVLTKTCVVGRTFSHFVNSCCLDFLDRYADLCGVIIVIEDKRPTQ